MNASWVSLAPGQMDSRVISPNDRVILIAKIKAKSQDVAEVASYRKYVRDVKYGTSLDELCWIRSGLVRHAESPI